MSAAIASRSVENQASFCYTLPSSVSGERPHLCSNSTSFADPVRPRTTKSTRTPQAGTESSETLASLPSSSGSSRHHPVVVPQYPYNVAMPQFQGLQASDRTSIADDNDVQTRLPSICVDYLSHDWDESDVWASWKAMTRHKNELANGVRLENASWRTWAKQRNNLKTISPETLNWLKDSDVTWLYGPLHTAVDPVPPPKLATLSDRLTLDDHSSTRSTTLINIVQSVSHTTASAPSSRPTSAMGHRPCKLPGKPILKYRSLSEILGVNDPVSPTASEPTSATATDDDAYGSCDDCRKRVTVASATPTKAITNKKDPDSLHAPNARTRTTLVEKSTEAVSREDCDARARAQTRHASAVEENGNSRKKKHISFSHRVEQCIAVDSSEEERGYNIGVTLDDEDEDEDNDMLMFRTASAMRQHARHQFIKRSEMSLQASEMNDDSISNSVSTDHVTIARMAPTTLKSAETYPPPSPAVIYEDASPPWKFKVLSSATQVSQSGEETERNESFVPSYFVRTFGSGGSIDAASIVNSHHSLLNHRIDVDREEDLLFKNRWEVDSEDFSSMGFDYFSGPDLGVGDEYDMPSLPSQHLISGAGYVPRGNPRSSAETSPASTPAAHKLRDPMDNLATPKSILKHTFGPAPAETVDQASSSRPIDVPGISSSSSSSSLFPQNFSSQFNSSVVSSPHTEYTVGTSSPIPDKPDRRSRGRSSSRGSSASSFERSSGSDRRAASSPSQSPPGSLGVGSAVNRSSGGTSLGARSGRPGASLIRSSSSNSLSSDGKWSRGLDDEDGAIDAPSGKGLQAMNGTDTPDLRAASASSDFGGNGEPDGMGQGAEENVAASKRERRRLKQQSQTRTSEKSDTADDLQHASVRQSPPKSAHDMSGSTRFLTAPRPASTQLAEESDNEHLFDSPHLPSSPTSLEPSSCVPKRTGSFSSIASLRWSDETPVSIAHRSLLRQYSARHCTTTFRGSSQQPKSNLEGNSGGGHGGGADGRTYSDDDTSSRRLSGDDYGFGYGCSDDEDVGGVVGRAAEFMGTAKDLVGALWTVGSRSLWRKSGLATSEGNTN